MHDETFDVYRARGGRGTQAPTGESVVYAHNEPDARVTFEISHPEAAARSVNSRRVRSFPPSWTIICSCVSPVSRKKITDKQQDVL